MTSEQLRYVVELANYQTLQKTADTLHITKSGLSKAIHQVEKELGVQLFHRTPSGTFLTQQGHELLPIMEKELNINFSLHQSAAELKSSPDGKIVRVGHANSLLRPVVGEFLKIKKAQQPTRLEISQHSPTRLIELVRSQQLDLAFIDVDKDTINELSSSLNFHEIHHGPLQLYVRDDNFLAPKSELSIDDIRALKFVTMNDPLSQKIFNHLQNVCGPLKVVLKTDDYWSACEAASQLDAGIVACSMMLKNATNDFDHWHFCEKQLHNLISDNVYHGWISNPGRPLDQPTLQFVHQVAERIVSVLD